MLFWGKWIWSVSKSSSSSVISKKKNKWNILVFCFLVSKNLVVSNEEGNYQPFQNSRGERYKENSSRKRIKYTLERMWEKRKSSGPYQEFWVQILRFCSANCFSLSDPTFLTFVMGVITFAGFWKSVEVWYIKYFCKL